MSEIGEGAHLPKPGEIVELKQAPENPKSIFLHAFLGDRNKEFVMKFNESLEASKTEPALSPTETECLIYTGHVGISFEAQSPIFGFNPSTGQEAAGWVIENLKAGKSYPGKVTDDTTAFNEAPKRGLTIERIEYVCSEATYQRIKAAFDVEKQKTHFRYSFPDQTGDCNCATWPAFIGIPLPCVNGKMSVYVKQMREGDKRRFLGLIEMDS